MTNVWKLQSAGWKGWCFRGSDTDSEVTEWKVWKQSWLFQQKYNHKMIQCWQCALTMTEAWGQHSVVVFKIVIHTCVYIMSSRRNSSKTFVHLYKSAWHLSPLCSPQTRHYLYTEPLQLNLGQHIHKYSFNFKTFNFKKQKTEQYKPQDICLFPHIINWFTCQSF